jgi:hypothetical protein
MTPATSRRAPPVRALAVQRTPHALALRAAARPLGACGARARRASFTAVAAAAEEAAIVDTIATELPATPPPPPPPPPPPYAALSVPVYSLATAAPAGGEMCRASMNIVTYAAPMTLKPKVRRACGQLHAGASSHATARRALTRRAPPLAAGSRRCAEMPPQRLFSVALYHDTLTLANMERTRKGVMQILGEQHARLVPLLGKTRGQDVDKVRA